MGLSAWYNAVVCGQELVDVTSQNGWPVIGHDWAVAHLCRSLAHGRVRHAYLITGPDSVGKTTLARAFAQAINCQGDAPPCGACRSCQLIARGVHPDAPIVEAEREGGALKIDQARGLQQLLALRPVEARYRTPMLLRFHEATLAAQDALLKTLEEPPPHVVLILTAERADALLPTIVSRCQVLSLRPLPLETVQSALQACFGVPAAQADLLARLSGGRLGWAVRAAAAPELLGARTEALDQLETLLREDRVARFRYAAQAAKDAAALRELLVAWQVFWRDVLMVASGGDVPVVNVDRQGTVQALARSAGVEGAGAALEAVGAALDRFSRNANARLTLEVLLMDLPSDKR